MSETAADGTTGTDAGTGTDADDSQDDGDPPRAIRNPLTGVTIREPPDGGEGAEIVLAPGASGPAEHVHPEIEERFAVTEGRPTFRVDGRERTLDPGADVWISPGTPHAFRNETDDPARIRVRTVPESEELGAVVATLFGLAVEGKTDETGRPTPLQAAVMAEETLDETYFADVPRPVQRAFGDLLGPVGRALGYEATYEKYTSESFWRDHA